MKKLVALVLVIVVLTLAGCGKKNNEETTPAVDATGETQQQEIVMPEANDEWGSPGAED